MDETCYRPGCNHPITGSSDYCSPFCEKNKSWHVHSQRLSNLFTVFACISVVFLIAALVNHNPWTVLVNTSAVWANGILVYYYQKD